MHGVGQLLLAHAPPSSSAHTLLIEILNKCWWKHECPLYKWVSPTDWTMWKNGFFFKYEKYAWTKICYSTKHFFSSRTSFLNITFPYQGCPVMNPERPDLPSWSKATLSCLGHLSGVSWMPCVKGYFNSGPEGSFVARAKDHRSKSQIGSDLENTPS